MSPDEAAFLKAITDSPADETARLVYADWLAERDDPRAAFARLSGEFLRCVRGLADLRRSQQVEWLEVMDPLFNRLMVYALPHLGTGVQDVTVTDVLVAPGSPFVAGQPLLTVRNQLARVELSAQAPGLVTAVLVRPGESVTVNQPLLTYLSGQEKFALRTPRGPMLAFIQTLVDQRRSLRQSPRELNEALLARHATALQMVFGGSAVHRAWLAAERSRGWDTGARSLEERMRERGFTPDQAVQERIDVHIETLRVLLATHGQPDGLRETPVPPTVPAPKDELADGG
jgi:uncharacterized protein (TIGR02996 family)